MAAQDPRVNPVREVADAVQQKPRHDLRDLNERHLQHVQPAQDAAAVLLRSLQVCRLLFEVGAAATIVANSGRFGGPLVLVVVVVLCVLRLLLLSRRLQLFLFPLGPSACRRFHAAAIMSTPASTAACRAGLAGRRGFLAPTQQPGHESLRPEALGQRVRERRRGHDPAEGPEADAVGGDHAVLLAEQHDRVHEGVAEDDVGEGRAAVARVPRKGALEGEEQHAEAAEAGADQQAPLGVERVFAADPAEVGPQESRQRQLAQHLDALEEPEAGAVLGNGARVAPEDGRVGPHPALLVGDVQLVDRIEEGPEPDRHHRGQAEGKQDEDDHRVELHRVVLGVAVRALDRRVAGQPVLDAPRRVLLARGGAGVRRVRGDGRALEGRQGHAAHRRVGEEDDGAGDLVRDVLEVAQHPRRP